MNNSPTSRGSAPLRANGATAPKPSAAGAASYSGLGGRCTLVGAGPGDPELLTIKAAKAIASATVLFVDDLVNPAVLEHAAPQARIVQVGKRGGCKSTPQAFIHKLMVQAVQEGEAVVRLKGGDPFIFGRGGEVVPGVTAAAGCASYAGIPLTHRDHAQSCTFVTGHLKDGNINLNWQQLAAPQQTIVIYMGLVGLEKICEALIAHGCPTDHPIAIVQQGTTRNQKVLTGTLSDMPRKVSQADIQPPTLIIVGTVVTLREKLNWFQHQQVT